MEKAAKAIFYKSQILKLSSLNMFYVEVPPAIIKKMGSKFKLRLWCSINKNNAFQCGVVSLGNGSGYISINKKRMKEFNIALGDKVNVSIEKDDSEFGMEVPEELSEIFAQDELAYSRFMALTPGKQRYIIYYVSMVKNSQKRIDRALLLLENLKKTAPGKESFRAMLGLD